MGTRNGDISACWSSLATRRSRYPSPQLRRSTSISQGELSRPPAIVPDDAWLQVLAPCRQDLIRRTVDTLKGAKKAILHIYLATSECFRCIVFGFSEEESIQRAVACAKYARSITKDDLEQAGTEWAFEFSPETFSDTSPEFAVRICEAAKAAWEPTKENPIIFNLPATVEMSKPDVYADQIEWLRGGGNGPISSLADALRCVGIELDVDDYKEHAIGGGREVKAATCVECTAAGTSQKVWGVGIHEDVVQSSLMALLGEASNVIHPSRPGSPITVKLPQRSLSQELDLNGQLRPPTVATGSVTSHAGPSNLVQRLEEKVNGV
ncbi:hypothetical protein DL771_000916 [Monosporascus sp. 5C6A]|nr:hypothetical protein DL771_000916 [Monosporascus sp. 5C6A]